MVAAVATPWVRTVSGARVRLRSLRRGDGKRWRELRVANELALRRVEPTVAGDWRAAHSGSAWRSMYAHLVKSRRRGELFPLVIESNGAFVGQVTLGNIQHGSVSNCWIGYWVAGEYAGQGIATVATALGTDFAMHRLGLHRVEATVMEDNVASIAVLRNTGFRQEGRLQRNIHINGVWQDHLLMAQTVEDIRPFSVVQRLISEGKAQADLQG